MGMILSQFSRVGCLQGDIDGSADVRFTGYSEYGTAITVNLGAALSRSGRLLLPSWKE
jgi:hypothetical protein